MGRCGTAGTGEGDGGVVGGRVGGSVVREGRGACLSYLKVEAEGGVGWHNVEAASWS